MGSSGIPDGGAYLHRFVSSCKGACRTFSSLHPARIALFGYLSYIVVGWFVLSLPLSMEGNKVGALDNLFTTVSAISTTGLVTVSIADNYSFFGQVVILFLIQLGGIGYMTLGSFLVLARRRELPDVRKAVSRTVFSLPEGFKIDRFILGVVFFTVFIEACGIAAYYPCFLNAGVDNPLWSAVFHSVSAFCTAGFSLYNNSFEAFAGNFWLNAVTAALGYLGAVGFIVCVDFGRIFIGSSKQVTLTTKIILSATLALTFIGTAHLFLAEPSIQHMAPEKRILAAFFQCMNAITTMGFNSVSIADLSKSSVLVLTVLMIIGSSPSGTGGGIKVTSVTAVLGVMRSTINGESDVHFWGRVVPRERIWIAVSNIGLYLIALSIGAYLLELSEKTSFEKNFFEAASAIGTVGLSMGITSGLSAIGKIVIILLMFCGRVGPLTLSTALFGGSPKEEKEEHPGDIAV